MLRNQRRRQYAVFFYSHNFYSGRADFAFYLRGGHIKISGTEIAHKVFDTVTGGNKSFAWIDISLNEDVDRSLLEGKKTRK